MDTISVSELVQAYEPSLLEAVQRLLALDWPEAGRLPLPAAQNGPLHCCALFGLTSVAAALLRAGADPRAPGWHELAAYLEGATLEVMPLQAGLDASNTLAGQPSLNQPMDEDHFLQGQLCPLAGPLAPPTRAWMELSLPAASSPSGPQLVEEVEASELTAQEFQAVAFRPRRPLLLRRGLGRAAEALGELLPALLGEGGEGCRSSSSSQRLSLLPYPEDFVPPELLPEASWPGLGAKEVLAGHRGYLFLEAAEGTALARRLDEALRLREALPFAFQGRSPRILRQISLGQSGSGAPWHWHQDAFNVCLAGERAWLLRPPAKALMSRRPVSAGLEGADGALFAAQRPGDILYVPELWAHCVVNRTLSAAVALEFGTL